ncbi:sensor histidine kinase [Bradyrhizobium cajani]|uniref:histidine kinase n=1 Tax=Bradyrhizobium cajani TaxID=1928661 RepID=A0A844T335_9BRAD|nr:HAMP domain-containing sensor histidine kinase [Bradyrhizobium cajani]MCP3369598.1 HAMP domain-containing histidine kinase [Bradyrhizobium cajani]MVT72005.1 sensor histidine kinase [Bradyrhizobium cajani]
MNRIHGSITLIAAALLSAVIGIILLCVLTLQFSFMGDDGTFARYDAAAAIKAAIDRNERGELIINERGTKAAKVTPTLLEFKRDFSGFWYAVSDGRSVIQYGPVPVRVLAGLADERKKESFSEYAASDGSMRLSRSAIVDQTDAGETLIELGGATYSRWQMFKSTFQDMTYVTIPIIVVLVGTILAAILIVPTLIARPVRRVAAAAELVDGTREGVRLPEGSAPLELIPMVSAFNRALDRIDATTSAQRRFLSNAAHELRTPLARVRTRLEGVSDKALKTALVSDLQSLSSVITMLLQLARLSSARAEEAEVDLVATAKRIAAEHAPGALDSGVEIEFSAPGEPVRTYGSDQAIGIALANIVRNSLQHSREGQRVLVEVDSAATVRVIDHGPGIAPEDRSAVLQPFVRARQDGEGTGLGLAIVAQVMALHKGLVAIEDTPGGGTTIVLRFPPTETPSIPARDCGREKTAA